MPAGTEIDMVEVLVPEPGSEDGLKVAAGHPLGTVALRVIALLSVPVTVAVICVLVLLPAVTGSDAGEALRLKLAACVEPARAAMRPALGLPHPVTRS